MPAWTSPVGPSQVDVFSQHASNLLHSGIQPVTCTRDQLGQGLAKKLRASGRVLTDLLPPSVSWLPRVSRSIRMDWPATSFQ